MSRYQQVIGRTGIYLESVLHLKNPKIVIPAMRLDQMAERLTDYYRMDKQVRLGRPEELSNWHDTILGVFREREREHINDHTDRVIYDFVYHKNAIKQSDIDLIKNYVSTQPDMEIFVNGLLVTLEIIEEKPNGQF